MSKNEKNERTQEIEDLKTILALDEGRRLFWRIFEFAGLYRTPSTGESLSTHENIGQHRVGLWLLDEAMEANPAAVAKLIVNGKLLEKEDARRDRTTE